MINRTSLYNTYSQSKWRLISANAMRINRTAISSDGWYDSPRRELKRELCYVYGNAMSVIASLEAFIPAFISTFVT